MTTKTEKKTSVVPVKRNSSSAVSKADMERQKILSEASGTFLEMHDKIVDCLVGENISIFESRYKIGEMVETMRADPDTYGPKAVERMELLIGRDRSVIYDAVRFVQRYTKEDLENLLEVRNRAGRSLMWTHIAHLSRIPDRKVRESIQQETLDNNWSPEELLTFIQAKQGGKKRPNSGKPLARPKSLKGFIDQQFSVLDLVLNRKRKVWDGKQKDDDFTFFDVLDTTQPSKIDGSMLTQLEQLQERYEAVSMEFDSMANDILKHRRRLEQLKSKPKLDMEVESLKPMKGSSARDDEDDEETEDQDDEASASDDNSFVEEEEPSGKPTKKSAPAAVKVKASKQQIGKKKAHPVFG